MSSLLLEKDSALHETIKKLEVKISRQSVASQVKAITSDPAFQTLSERARLMRERRQRARSLSMPLASSVSTVVAETGLIPLDEAYERCRLETEEWAKTFYLGTMLMPPEKRRAIWAIYVWCRRTDEIMDSPEAMASLRMSCWIFSISGNVIRGRFLKVEP